MLYTTRDTRTKQPVGRSGRLTTAGKVVGKRVQNLVKLKENATLKNIWLKMDIYVYESDNSDQIKKMFDDKICTSVSLNSGKHLFALTNPARDTPIIESAIAINKI